MKKKVFITGIGGYVGSALAQGLSSKYVIVGFGHRHNFPKLKKIFPKSVKLISGDVTDKKALVRASRGAYAVIHTAAPTTEKFCREHPVEATQSIVRGTKFVYEAAAENKIPIFIHFSTQAVYSNFQKRPLPLREDIKLIPDTLYGKLKTKAEFGIMSLRSNSKGSIPDVVIVRPSNIYGVGSGIMRNNVVHMFVEKAKRGEPLQVRGGAQRVDFVHIRDILGFIAQVLASKKGSRGPLVVNIGSGRAVPIKKLSFLVAKEAKKILKRTIVVHFERVDKNTIAADRYLSITQAKKLFGWKPEISLEQGIKELLMKSH